MAGGGVAVERGRPLRANSGIQVIVESETIETLAVQEVATLERGPLEPERLGPTLAEAKDLLRGVRETRAAGQVTRVAPGLSRSPNPSRIIGRSSRK